MLPGFSLTRFVFRTPSKSPPPLAFRTPFALCETKLHSLIVREANRPLTFTSRRALRFVRGKNCAYCVASYTQKRLVVTFFYPTRRRISFLEKDQFFSIIACVFVIHRLAVLKKAKHDSNSSF